MDRCKDAWDEGGSYPEGRGGQGRGMHSCRVLPAAWGGRAQFAPHRTTLQRVRHLLTGRHGYLLCKCRQGGGAGKAHHLPAEGDEGAPSPRGDDGAWGRSQDYSGCSGVWASPSPPSSSRYPRRWEGHCRGCTSANPMHACKQPTCSMQ